MFIWLFSWKSEDKDDKENLIGRHGKHLRAPQKNGWHLKSLDQSNWEQTWLDTLESWNPGHTLESWNPALAERYRYSMFIPSFFTSQVVNRKPHRHLLDQTCDSTLWWKARFPWFKHLSMKAPKKLLRVMHSVRLILASHLPTLHNDDNQNNHGNKDPSTFH